MPRKGRKADSNSNSETGERKINSEIPYIYNAAVYVRISVDDVKTSDSIDKQTSNSTSAQKSICISYLQSQADLKLHDIYEDVNYTGTNFDRPGFIRMMSDINNGAVNCVIVKDLSRFGRSFEEAGDYLERVFPASMVRFIAVNDMYDSITASTDESSLTLPLKNLINEAYAREISKKVQSGYKLKQRRGEFCGSFAPYGYIKRGTSLFIDEEAALVVRQIFTSVIEGYSDSEIAQILNNQKILPPSRYRYEKGITQAKHNRDKCLWYKSTIKRIAENPVYTGDLAQGRYKSCFRRGEVVETSSDDWIVLQYTHTAIITGEIFENTQRIRETRRQSAFEKNLDMGYAFEGLEFKADCQAPDKYLAYYLRLSLDDEGDTESNSITNQRHIIEGYIAAIPELANMKRVEFCDDGYSGVNFIRPDIMRLLEAVSKGEVCCVAVKDFSRFGRQYLEAGKLIEQVFPYMGIRFIAINDHYDSAAHKGMPVELDVPVRNLLNELYSIDVSRKVKSAKQIKIKRGELAYSHTIFGYKKDTEDNHKLEIDEPAADIVRQIFRMADRGIDSSAIAVILNEKSFPTPALWKSSQGYNLKCRNIQSEYHWTASQVSRILSDERYTGTYVGGMWENGAVGSNKRIHKSKDEWVKMQSVHPIIISEELFYSVAEKRWQPSIRKKTRRNNNRMLYKKVFCGNCGHMMRYRGDVSRPFYSCETSRYAKGFECSQGNIREQGLASVIIECIHKYEDIFIKTEMQSGKMVLSKYIQKADAAEAKHEAEKIRLYESKRFLYERYKHGLLDKETFKSKIKALDAVLSKKSVDYESEQHSNIEKDAKSNQIIQKESDIINGLVEAVRVYSPDKIEIIFSFEDRLALATGMKSY